MRHHPIRELPIDQVEPDPDSPHLGFGTPEEDGQLRASIEQFGIMGPLIVCQHGQDHYFIIDGVRRHRLARELGLRKLWCTVFPPMASAERELLRFQLEMTYRPLTQEELTKQRRRLRKLGVIPPERAA
jgi:ParB-like chromosome segregation protein Spo0J